jgi:hypothetical protein
MISVSGLKKMWRFFGTLFTKFKDKKIFIKEEEGRLVDQVLLKESMRSWTRWKARSPYKEHTVDISLQKCPKPSQRSSQLKIERNGIPAELFPRTAERMIQLAIARKLSRWRKR